MRKISLQLFSQSPGGRTDGRTDGGGWLVAQSCWHSSHYSSTTRLCLPAPVIWYTPCLCMQPTNQTMQELIYIATIAILISPLLCLFSFHSSRWLWLVACLTVVEHLTHPQKQKMVTCTQVIIIIRLINCLALNTRPLLPQFCFVACGDFIWRLNGVNWSDGTDCCTSSWWWVDDNNKIIILWGLW